MTLESLETLNDEQLMALIARAGALLKQHDRERKDRALADARSILAGAGLSLKHLEAISRSRKSAKLHRRSKSARVPTFANTSTHVNSQETGTGLD
jgi:hypothetical protein